MVNSIKINKKLILLFLIFIVIFLSIISIFLINKYYFNSTSNIGYNLKGYTPLKEKLNSLKLKDDSRYSQAIVEFNIVENNNSLPEDKYNALTQVALLLSNSYSRTHDPKIYEFVKNDLNTFTKENFKNYYKEINFMIPCQDPSCADSPTPKEIIDIINEINSLEKISKAHREIMILNLQYNSYLPSNNINFKATSYLGTAQIIRGDKQFTDAGVNNKIADEIEIFVKNKYPNDYIKLPPPNTDN